AGRKADDVRATILSTATIWNAIVVGLLMVPTTLLGEANTVRGWIVPGTLLMAVALATVLTQPWREGESRVDASGESAEAGSPFLTSYSGHIIVEPQVPARIVVSESSGCPIVVCNSRKGRMSCWFTKACEEHAICKEVVICDGVERARIQFAVAFDSDT